MNSPPLAAAAVAACGRLFKRAMPGRGARSQAAAQPARLRSEPGKRLIHPAWHGACPSVGGCELNLLSCVCTKEWPFCSAKERSGVLWKAAKCNESKGGRRASFCAGHSTPPAPPFQLLGVNCRFTMGVSPNRALADCISNTGIPPLLETRSLQARLLLPKLTSTFPSFH